MATIEEVKSGLGQAAQQGGTVAGQARAAAESADKMISQLQGVARGTNHPKVTEAIQRAQQAKQQLQQAAQMAQAAAQAARDYVGILG